MPCPAQATPAATGSATGPVPRVVQAHYRRAGPCRACRFKESTALRRRLEEALFRRDERGGKLGDGAQRRIVIRRGRAVRVSKEDPIGKAAAFAEHHRKPGPQRFGVA